MAIIIYRTEGRTSVLRLIPKGVLRKHDRKEFMISDKIERRGEIFVAHVVAREPTPLESLPGDVAAAATNIVKVGEISAREAFGIARMFERPVPIFDVIYTPQYEGFKVSFDAAMMDEAQNDDWEFIWPDVESEVEKWKQSAPGEYVSHEAVTLADVPMDRAARVEQAKNLT